mmetsp:Transcript_26153/g.83952  ORF Transcript_26153/g.83952 Transcript_26153/m.83952 type:complete len:277 (-) Transcript_26153:324-1154(-)
MVRPRGRGRACEHTPDCGPDPGARHLHPHLHLCGKGDRQGGSRPLQGRVAGHLDDGAKVHHRRLLDRLLGLPLCLDGRVRGDSPRHTRRRTAHARGLLRRRPPLLPPRHCLWRPPHRHSLRSLATRRFHRGVDGVLRDALPLRKEGALHRAHAAARLLPRHVRRRGQVGDAAGRDLRVLRGRQGEELHGDVRGAHDRLHPLRSHHAQLHAARLAGLHAGAGLHARPLHGRAHPQVPHSRDNIPVREGERRREQRVEADGARPGEGRGGRDRRVGPA